MEDKELDKFEKKHIEKLEELETCQKNKNLTSCRKCEKFYDCNIRCDYVDAVFHSMNKGKTGGFEF